MSCKNCLADADPTATGEGYPRNGFCSASCEAAFRLRAAEGSQTKFPWAALLIGLVFSFVLFFAK